MWTNPFEEEGSNGGQSERIHIRHLTGVMARRLEEECVHNTLFLLENQLLIVLHFWSSLVKFLQSTIDFILGLHLGHVLGQLE